METWDSKILKGNLLAFRLLLWWKWDLRSSGMLHNVHWYLVTDVSEQLIGPVLNLSILTSMGRLKTLASNNQNTLHNIPEEWRSHELDFLGFYWKNSHCVCVCVGVCVFVCSVCVCVCLCALCVCVLCVCVCVCVCSLLYVYVCMYLCMYVCMCEFMYKVWRNTFWSKFYGLQNGCFILTLPTVLFI
jgi:hypothetical protein